MKMKDTIEFNEDVVVKLLRILKREVKKIENAKDKKTYNEVLSILKDKEFEYSELDYIGMRIYVNDVVNAREKLKVQMNKSIKVLNRLIKLHKIAISRD